MIGLVDRPCRSRNINVIEIGDKSAWREVCSPVIQEYATGELADLYQQIVDMAK